MTTKTLGWAVPAMIAFAAGCADAPRVLAQAPAMAPSMAPAKMKPAATLQKPGAYLWRSVKVGGGGFIPGIVFSPVERGLAYLRSDMGGAYRWDAAQKTWLPLQDQFAQSSYFGTESIVPDPVDPNTVYMAAGMYRGDDAAILRSRDKGKTFEVFPVSFKMGGNEDGRGLGERLAVDPNLTSTLYFGSRHDGLMKSTDSGATWNKVASFPLQGGGNAGLSFVVFDKSSGARGAATKTIFVGNADAGAQHLFRSDDAGATWKAVAGEPKAEFLPAKAELESTGMLYITYGNGVGPNGVTDGAVMKLNTKTGQWTDISPDKRPVGQGGRGPGGYMGISLDREHPGTLGVTTMNRWGPVDTVWRTTDGGATWSDIVGKVKLDISSAPFLTFGQPQPKIGWWMSAFAIDPFNPDYAAYGTGATIFATDKFSDVSKGATTTWTPWTNGIEQTAIITLMSPSAGPHLLSGFGDIGGFVHTDLSKSPAGMYTNPVFTNTNTLEYAGKAPTVIVRSGRAGNGEATLAYSEDSGKSWQPLVLPPAPAAAPVPAAGGRRRGGGGGNPPIIVGADGKTFMVMTAIPQITKDKGATWTAVTGLPANVRPIADRVNAMKFYALDYAGGKLFLSTDGGTSFTASPTTGLPADISGDARTGAEQVSTFMATNDREGDLWLVSRQGLFHSADSGATFVKTPGTLNVEMLSLGKAPAGSTYPALFAIGRQGNLRAVWRSDNQGQSWVRVNDELHQYGNRFRCIAADPQTFGRVYIGTDGRGILYGEPVGTVD